MWKAIDYDACYLDEMIEMTMEQYGPDNDISDREFLLHQYFENPAGDAHISLALDEQNSEVAGQYVIWPMQFECGNDYIVCANSLNTLTDRCYRGQGIFTGLAEHNYQSAEKSGVRFIYGIPNQNSYPGFVGKLHFEELGAIPLLLRPLKPSKMVKEFLNANRLSAAAKLFDSAFMISQENNADIIIQTITEDNVALLDEFWNQVKGKYPVMNVRNTDYVRFRYLTMPRRKYYPLIAVKNDIPVAWAVGRIMEVAGMQCGMIADFLFCHAEENTAMGLLRALLLKLQENGASVAGSLMLAHTEESHLLKRSGFFRCPKRFEPQPFPLLVRVLDSAYRNPELLNLNKWFFTMGDYDVI